MKNPTKRERQLQETIACENTRTQRDAEARGIERRMGWPEPLDTATFTCQTVILVIVAAFVWTM